MTTASGCDDPPSLGPLEIARKIPALPRAPIRGPSPGHQAGAPLRRSCPPVVHRWTLWLPPAIRPGLHCGSTRRASTTTARAFDPASPGHQAGAPLRRDDVAPCPMERGGLPPAIRPGLHCGRSPTGCSRVHQRPSPGHQAGAPLRPPVVGQSMMDDEMASPGHQAGAPLRHHVKCKPSQSWRPSPGHQAGAPLRLRGALGSAPIRCFFPRPSGRGSIAASLLRSWFLRW